MELTDTMHRALWLAAMNRGSLWAGYMTTPRGSQYLVAAPTVRALVARGLVVLSTCRDQECAGEEILVAAEAAGWTHTSTPRSHYLRRGPVVIEINAATNRVRRSFDYSALSERLARSHAEVRRWLGLGDRP